MQERLFGLIGRVLSHSFSKNYFSEKFVKEDIPNCRYELFPIPDIEAFPNLLKQFPNLVGLNVTIPYKQSVIKYLDELKGGAAEIEAVNTIKIEDGKLIGFNTDIIGFEVSLRRLLPNDSNLWPQSALVLGTGGAAKAINYVLDKLGIEFQTVSRTPEKGDLTYSALGHEQLEATHLIINTTPLGMAPKVDACPDIPYEKIGSTHFLFDLVYNPEKTLFLEQGEFQKASIKNGLEMLHLQAEAAWDIWNLPYA